MRNKYFFVISVFVLQCIHSPESFGQNGITVAGGSFEFGIADLRKRKHVHYHKLYEGLNTSLRHQEEELVGIAHDIRGRVNLHRATENEVVVRIILTHTSLFVVKTEIPLL